MTSFPFATILPHISSHQDTSTLSQIYYSHHIPGLCWPTKQDIEDSKEYESVAFPFTIQQMMETAAQKRKEEQHKIEQREKEVEAKFLKLDQWKKELNDKIQKKAKDTQAAKVNLIINRNK